MQLNSFLMAAHLKKICFSALVLLSLTSRSMDNLDLRLHAFSDKVNGAKFFGEADHAHAETIGFATQAVSTPGPISSNATMR